MRWIAVTFVVLAWWVGIAGPLRAGLYNTAEPAATLSRNFATFRKDTLIVLRQIGSPQVQSGLNKRYELLAALGARGGPSTLSVEQRLDLCAYLVQFQKPREAVNILAPAQFQERDNFLVLANLATAELLAGLPRRAHDYQTDALRLWPKEWSGVSAERRAWLGQIGWSERDFSWYRDVETYQLKLLRLRVKEPARPANELPENVDALFDEGKGPIQFVGAGGKYEAGKLALEQRARLPRKAIEIVEQLLVWMPHDNRLYWLLGELFNADGDVAAAQEIFEEVLVKWNPRASKTNVAEAGFQREVTLPRLFKEHLDVLRAQPKAELVVAEPAAPPQPAAGQVGPGESNAGPPVEWKSLGVGFGAGLVVAFFAYWQIRELRRRRHRSPPLAA